jgi:uncharacterized protein YndB with AHSA1/START domain
MIRHDTSIEIGRPPAEVFEALLDLPGYDRWTEMRESRWVTPGEPRIGSRAQSQMPGGPLKGTFDIEIVELEPGRRVVFDTRHPALRWRSSAEVAPIPEGTRLHYFGEISLRGWRRILEPLMQGEVQAGERKEVERLKALLEASPAGGATVEASAGGSAPA